MSAERKKVVKTRNCVGSLGEGVGVEEMASHIWRGHQEAGRRPERGCPRSHKETGVFPVSGLLARAGAWLLGPATGR